MAERLNLTDLDVHARDEAASRRAGDLAAAATSAIHRRYVPPLELVILPSRWSILVADDFEIDQDGELEVSLDASLEILGSVSGVPGSGPLTSISVVAPIATTGGSAPTLSLIDDGVTYAKLQNVTAASRLLGRGSAAGAGDPEEVTLGTNLSMSGTTLNAAAGGTVPTGTGFRHVTAGAEDAASKLVDTADVNNDQVTYAKMQNVSAASRLLGRGSAAGAGDTEELTLGAGLSLSGTVLNRAEAWPVDSIFLSLSATNPNTSLGYGTWSLISQGRVLVGLDSGDTDFDTPGELRGAKTVASAGTNAAEAAHTHSVTSNVSVDDHDEHDHSGPSSHGTHNHTYAQVPNHTHKLSTILRTATTGADSTNVAQSVDASSTKDSTLETDNPTGGVATGTTTASVPLTHGVTGVTTESPHVVNNPAVTSGAGSSHNHAFTGTPTSVVQPSFVCYMWQRTA